MTTRSEGPDGPAEGPGPGSPEEGPGPEEEPGLQQGEDNTNEDQSRARSGRAVRAPARLDLRQCHLDTQGHAEERHSTETAEVPKFQLFCGMFGRFKRNPNACFSIIIIITFIRY